MPPHPIPKKKLIKTVGPDLTAKEVAFCQHLNASDNGNATEAYVKAALPHQTRNDAGVRAWHLLRKPKIRLYLRRLQEDATAQAMVTVGSLARGFAGAVDADLTQMLGPDGEMLPPNKWPEAIRLAIIRIEADELSERVPDPERPGKMKKVAVGTRWKVWLENKTECRKVLAQWKRMIGSEAETQKPPPAPLVVRGVDPDEL